MTKKAVLTVIITLLVLSCKTSICMEEVNQDNCNSFPIGQLPPELQNLVLSYIVKGLSLDSAVFEIEEKVLSKFESKESRSRQRVKILSSRSTAITILDDKNIITASVCGSELKPRVAFRSSKGEETRNRKKFSFPGQQAITSTEFGKEGKIFFSCGNDSESKIYYGNLRKNEKNLKQFVRLYSRCNRLRYDQKNKKIVFASADGYIRIWDLEKKRHTGKLKHNGEVLDLALHTDTKEIVSCARDAHDRTSKETNDKTNDKGSLYFWDRKQSKVVSVVSCGERLPTTLDVNDNGEIVFGDKKGDVVIYDRYTGGFRLIGTLSGRVNNVKFLSPNIVIASFFDESGGVMRYGGISFWSVCQKKELLRLKNIKSFDYNKKEGVLAMMQAGGGNREKSRCVTHSFKEFKLVTDWLAKGCPVRRSLVLNEDQYQMDYVQYAILLVKIDQFLNSNKENKLELSGTERIYFNALPEEIREILQDCINDKQESVSQSKKSGSRRCTIM